MDSRRLKMFAELAHDAGTGGRSEPSDGDLAREMDLLEAELGLRLFVEGSDHAELTGAGRRFLEHAEVMVALADRAVRDARAHDDKGSVGDACVIDALTRRERQVAELLTVGLTSAEIASILFVSKRTVDHQRASLFHKLGVHSRAELVFRYHACSCGDLSSSPERGRATN
jgi:DNA-binding CsgD family transcriptional regulator